MASNTYSRIHQKIAPCSQTGGTRMRATCPAFRPSPLFLSLSPLAILRSFLLTSCPFPELLISLWARHSNHRCLPLSFYTIVRLLFSSNVLFFISLMSGFCHSRSISPLFVNSLIGKCIFVTYLFLYIICIKIHICRTLMIY